MNRPMVTPPNLEVDSLVAAMRLYNLIWFLTHDYLAPVRATAGR